MNKGVFLCVDDELIVLVALKDQLRKVYGHEHIIEAAQSAQEGLEILDELVGDGFMPLVIISDWLMPGMKGDEFLIEAHKRFPKVIKVMLSGQADADAVARVREAANLHEFLSKPWDAEDLIRTVDAGLKSIAPPSA